MKLSLYNTLTRKKEEFVPIIPGKASLYSCGPTVYRDPSIGNYRAAFTADLIRNTLKLLGYDVTAVMNITDVGHLVGDGDEGEDKLEKGSKREGISAWDVAKKYENMFKDGLKKLHIDEFDVMPRATEHIQEQIAMVKTLEEKGYTYEVPGDGIYMDTSKIDDYGKLMGANYKKRLEDLQAGERVDMGGKKHATDFALWKFSPVDEKRQMERDSPRGMGFPGWHIECSAMSSKYLGTSFDIHHGGADHITVHHSNEIAQSECAYGHKPWVNYWIHNEFLQVDGGKMSKSLGNVYTIDDLEKKPFHFSCLDLRMFYFLAQYGNFQNFTWDVLKQAGSRRDSFVSRLYPIFLERDYLSSHYDIIENLSTYDEFKKCSELKLSPNSLVKFDAILSNTLLDNLNTPNLISELDLLLNFYVLDICNESEKEIYVDDVLQFVMFLDKAILKLDILEFLKGVKNYSLNIPTEINALADQRVQAKKDKNYALADELRNQIISQGYQIKDTKDGYEIIKG